MMGPTVGGPPYSMQMGRQTNVPKQWISTNNRDSQMRAFAHMFGMTNLPRHELQPHSRTESARKRQANYEFMVKDYGPGPIWRTNRPIQSMTRAEGRVRNCEFTGFNKFTNKMRADLQKFQRPEEFTNFTELREKLGSHCFSHGKYDKNERREVGSLTMYPFLTWEDRLPRQKCGVEYPGDAGGYHHQQQAFQTSNTSYGGFVYSNNLYRDKVRQPNAYCHSGLATVAGNTCFGTCQPAACAPGLRRP